MSSVLPTYARVDLAFESGEGAWLRTKDGEDWLDFGSGIAVAALGYGHPHLAKTLEEAARRVWHVSNIFKIPDQERLAERLTAATFADLVFFSNSGAEANEGAVKIARKHQSFNGRPERWRVLTFEGAFHGRTLAMIAAGGQKKYLEGFGPKVEGFDQVPFGDHDALKAAVGPETAAILVEPIQGEGGVRALPPQCLRGLRDLCDEHGLLLIFDEVQTGIGRSGALFAHERAGVAPDILTAAKGLGGGFPIGAILMTEAAAAGMAVGSHGTTFGGNPLACAVANAVLDVVLAPGFLEGVQDRALRLKQKLASLKDRFPDVVAEIRGEGFLMGLKCRVPPAEAAAAFRRRKLITIPAGDDVVRLLPPLVATEEDLDEGVRRLEAGLEELSAALRRSAAE